MSDPRLSIIPAGAVTDARLEPRDLQVLCLLGRHTDNKGWCSRSQVKMARELSCGRATVQRALERLEEAGWIEHRPEVRPDGGDRAHFYRVILDVAEPIKLPDESPAETPAESEGGVPIGGQGVPALDGQGVPTHERAPIRTTPLNDDDETARARATVSTEEERELVNAAGAALDLTAANLFVMAEPMRWKAAGLDWSLDVLPAIRAAASRAPPGRVRSWAYFSQAIADHHAARTKPMPAGNPRIHENGRRARPTTGDIARAFAAQQRERDSDGGERSTLPAVRCLPGT